MEAIPSRIGATPATGTTRAYYKVSVIPPLVLAAVAAVAAVAGSRRRRFVWR